MSEYSSSVVIITGAAQGIGMALAKKFGLAGAKVVLVDIQEKLGINVLKDLKNLGIEAHFIHADLEKENQIEKMITETVKIFGSLDILINNARVHLVKKQFPSSLDNWDKALAIMLKAPAVAIKFALPYLEKSNNSCILNISSTNSFLISDQPLTYHIVKSSILQLTRHLAVELASKKIRVNAICPGLVDIEDRSSMLTQDSVNNLLIKQIVPLQRAAKTDEIGELALFLGSNRASYITGQSYVIDGGMTLIDQFSVAKKVYSSNF